jgi:hypothetical protein
MALRQDKTLAGELFDRDGGAGEGMVTGNDGGDGVLVEDLGVEDLVEGRLEGPGEAHVYLSGEECVHLLGCGHLIERQLDFGVELAVFADDAREEAACSPEEEADGEGADLTLKRALGNFDGVIGGGESFARLFEEEYALRGEAGAALGSVE